MIWNIPQAVLVISVFLSSVGLLDSWHVLDSADWKLNFGSWVQWPPPTDGLFTRRHKELIFVFLFFFFFNSLHGLFGSSSSALRWPEFCWDVEFIVAVEITSELQKAERAQYRVSALASGRVTSLSVVEHRTERLPPVKEKRRMFSSGNKVENDFLWGWSVSCLGGLLFCRGVAAVGRTHFLCWHDEPGNSIITELWII